MVRGLGQGIGDNADVPLPFPETLDDTLSAWRLRGMAAGHSDRTIEARLGTIIRLARFVDPMAASQSDLTTWLARLVDNHGEPVKRSSKATYRAHLRAFYGWLVESGRREDDPAVKLPPLKPGRDCRTR